ncbi:DUF1801 domain-containing protein [Peribacillus simplex]|uniref:iron chaperone n=1 Tax=Peribacillus simplex TaxID=1478 RepID=UPI002989CC82|nr:DUF1801 domain-containing protein [Peribacillus simplex]MBX9955654.1 DUF1801 domain-containing protein [Peribacillus simplex]
MVVGTDTFHSIDEYITQFPDEVQERLKTLRKVIKDAAPEAEEKISYQMPTFVLYGNLVHFAAYKKHIGFYPTPNAISAFESALSEYKCSKGAVQFPLNKPIPYELITEMVIFRVEENKKKKQKANLKRKNNIDYYQN